MLIVLFLAGAVFSVEPSSHDPNSQIAKVAVIPCHEMIDQGLYGSIQRRTTLAIDQGFTHIIYEIDTFGGDLFAAVSISDYFLHDVNAKAHTVAYVSKKAISAGAMISVACKDIVMKKKTTIGDCAPIVMGGKLEGVEREKIESFTRAAFLNSAQANGYPQALLMAMVSQQLEVYSVKNLQSGKVEFFETADLPKDPNLYDIENKILIVRDDELLTLTAEDAVKYGVARDQVDDLQEAIDFIAERDDVTFQGQPAYFPMLWSEQMVRWINSPTVMGILIMITMLGIYIEFNTPGIGLPGLVAAICVVIIISSKYLTGLANWLEVALFLTGIILLLIEFLVLPGFGIAGILGFLCVAAGLFGMLIKNPPDKLPWPQTAFDWQLFANGIHGLIFGIVGFAFLVWLLSKYIPKTEFLSGLILKPAQAKIGQEFEVSMTALPQGETGGIKTGDRGSVLTTMRPAGKVKFGESIVDCIAQAEFIEKGTEVEIMEIHGNKVIVKHT